MIEALGVGAYQRQAWRDVDRQIEFARGDIRLQLGDDIAERLGQVQRANIQLTVAAPERLPGTWDLLAVEQIIDNLLSNALKYGDRRPVKLSAELVGCEVRLSVRDHGAGIPPQERERIFGQFERAVAQGKRGSGFGIGLWLVRQLAVALSGEVTVENHPSGGALFTVTLPQHAKGADT